MNKNALKVASFAISAFCFVFAIVSFFLLPEKIFVEVLGNSPVPETSTLLFCVIGALLVAASGIMSIYIENGKKWIALQSVLCIAFVGCLIYNLTVL
jgi:hypothetical protein